MHVLSYVYSYIYIFIYIVLYIYMYIVVLYLILHYIILYHIMSGGVYNTYFAMICINLSKVLKQQDVSCFTSSIWGPYYDAGRPLWCLQLAGKVHPMAVALDSTDLPRILVGGWLWIFESLGPMLFESKSKSFRWVSEQDCISILIQSCEV